MVEEDGLDAAELVDTSGRRTGLGGRGYGAAMATAALGCGGERGGAEGGKAQGPRGRAGEGRGGLEASRDVALIPSPTGTATGFGGDQPARPLGRVNREEGGDRGRWAAGLGRPDD